MNPQDALLSQLRDIHGAPEVAWWPPAPGWWVLAALLLVALVFAARHALRGWHARRRRIRLLAHLSRLEAETREGLAPRAYLAELNKLFKLVALRAFPEADVARLTGEQWAGFLAEKLDRKLTPGVESLADGPYMPEPDFDPAALGEAARTWVQRYG